MTGKIRTLALAEGLSFGRDGRYAVLEVLGRGWEGEVYAVADTEIKGAPNVKVAKFTSVVPDDFSVAPSWRSIDILQKKKKDPFKSDIPQDLLWYKFSSSDDKKKWIKAIEDVRKNAILTQKAAVTVPLLPQIEDYGIVVLPFEGNILPFIYQIMPFIPGSTLPVFIKRTTDHVAIAEKFLEIVVRAVCDYYKKGFLLGSDVHIENVMYDGEDFSLIDVSIDEVDKECSADGLLKTIKAVITVGYHIANWNAVGLSVSAYVQGKVDMPWLDDISALDKLPRQIPSATKTKIQQLVSSVRKDILPRSIWK